MQKKFFIVAAAAMVLAACAGRDAVPVAQVQPHDNDLSCEQIVAEQQDINNKVAALQRQKDEAHDSNVAIGAIGAILFWPALFALDTGDAEDVEMRAYRSRSQHLSMVATNKGCLTGDPTTTETVPTSTGTPAAGEAEPTVEAEAVTPADPDESVVCKLEGVVQPRTRGYCLEKGGKVMES